jgi:hypothetical protein
MRKFVLLAALALSFALYGNGASACANANHASAEQTTIAPDTGFYFEQVDGSQDHRAHHHHHTQDDRACDGCCGCGMSAGAALTTLSEIDYPSSLAVSHRAPLSNFNPRQLSSTFYGPPKSFA